SCCVSKKTPRLVSPWSDAGLACCAAISAAWRASALRASCRTERRTSTAATTSVTATAATTATAIAANSRARSDLTAPRAGGSRRDRLVAGTAHRPDQVGTPQLAPELRHVHVDGPRPACVVVAPDALEQQ